MVTAEVSVCNLEAEDTSAETNISNTPSQQRNLSNNIQADYTFYSLAYLTSRLVVCAIVEVKTRRKFNDNAVCQTIGYHLSRKIGICDDDDGEQGE